MAANAPAPASVNAAASAEENAKWRTNSRSQAAQQAYSIPASTKQAATAGHHGASRRAGSNDLHGPCLDYGFGYGHRGAINRHIKRIVHRLTPASLKRERGPRKNQHQGQNTENK